MDNTTAAISTYFSTLYVTTIAQTYAFLPKIIGAFLILIIGTIIAKWIKKILEKSLEFLHVSKLIKNTPLEAFFEHAEMGSKIEHVIGSIGYWLFMLLVIQTSVSALGLQSLAGILNQVLGYVPRIFSAILILFFGVLIAGVLESVVKGSVRSIDGRHSRLLGKFASYMTLIIFALVAVSELGIAQQFIIILFVGLVATLTISFGLAIGLGSKDVVHKIMDEWYTNFSKDLKSKE